MAMTKKQKRLLKNSEELLRESLGEAGYEGEIDPKALKLAKKLVKAEGFDADRAIRSLRRAREILDAV